VSERIFEKGQKVKVRGDIHDGVYEISLASQTRDGQYDILLKGKISILSQDMIIPLE
jgi:hypothetical protein